MSTDNPHRGQDHAEVTRLVPGIVELQQQSAPLDEALLADVQFVLEEQLQELGMAEDGHSNAKGKPSLLR